MWAGMVCPGPRENTWLCQGEVQEGGTGSMSSRPWLVYIVAPMSASLSVSLTGPLKLLATQRVTLDSVPT